MTVKTEANPELDVEAYGEISAHVSHYGPTQAGEVLRRLGVSAEAWATADAKYTSEIMAELARDESTIGERFGLAVARVKKRLRAERPPIESIGPLTSDAAAKDDVSTGSPEPPRATTPPNEASVVPAEPVAAPEPLPAVAVRAIEMPSFMKLAESRGPGSPAPIGATPSQPVEVSPPARPEGTLPVFILPRSLSLPFAGSSPPSEAVQRAKAQAHLVQGPTKPAQAAIGETVAPSDLAAIMQKVMPFGSQTVPQGPAESAAAPAPTAALSGAPSPQPVPVRLAAQSPAATPQASSASAQPVMSPTLSLEQYASLCEDLRIAGDRGAEVLKRYGLSLEGKRSVDEHWQRQFQAQPTTYLAWERARSTYRAWLMQRGGK